MAKKSVSKKPAKKTARSSRKRAPGGRKSTPETSQAPADEAALEETPATVAPKSAETLAETLAKTPAKTPAETPADASSDDMATTAEPVAAAGAATESSGETAEDPGTFVSIKPPESEPRSGLMGGVLMTLVVVAGVGVGGYLTQDAWGPHLVRVFPDLVPAPEPDPRVEGLMGRLTVLESRLKERANAAGALSKLESERKRFSKDLITVIDRLESVEGQLSDVRRLAEAASGAPTMAVATQSLKEINERLARVEQEGGEAGAMLNRLSELEKSDGNVSALANRVEALEKTGGELTEALTRVVELEQAGGDAKAVTEALATIDHRLGALEQARQAVKSETRTAGAAARALVLAVAQLRDTLRRGDAYAADLETLGKLASDDTEIAAASATLAPHAERGIPTLAILREQFDSLAARIISAARSTPDDTWWQRAANKVSSLVSLRRIGAQEDDGSLEAGIARAEVLMRSGDLKAAVGEVEGVAGKLNDAARALTQPWLKIAKARLNAERALTALHVKAVALLVPGGG